MATQTAAPTGKPGSKANLAAVPLAAQGTAFSDRAVAWVRAHRQLASWAGTIVVIAAALFLWTLSTKRRAEAVGRRPTAFWEPPTKTWGARGKLETPTRRVQQRPASTS